MDLFTEKGQRLPERREVENPSARPEAGDWIVLGVIALYCLATAICPTVRAFYHFEFNYNEGWNVYNVSDVVHHVPLYGAKYGWTTVNYPALSFYVVAYLSRFTHDYLLTGRLLSLFSFGISCVLIGLIIKRLTGKVAPAVFGASFCLGLFCTQEPSYVGANDPQMFAQLFFLGGLLLYLSRAPSVAWIAATSFLFVLGGNIKHNLVEFPLVVFLDLCLVGRRKATQFLLFSAAFLAISLVGNVMVAGPFFVSKILTPRTYSLGRVIRQFLTYYGPIQLPFIAALFWVAWTITDRENRSRRLICFLFLASLLLGLGFSGVSGVSINGFFSNFLVLSIIMGILLHSAWSAAPPLFIRPKLWRWGVPIALCFCLLYTFYLSSYPRFWSELRHMPDEQRRFDAEVSFLKAQPGPALCESLLRCYYAGKPYVYDPFNSTLLMRLGKLDSREIVSKIETQQYGAIQFGGTLESFRRPNDRFPDEILQAIGRHYVVALQHPNCFIYVPRSDAKAQVTQAAGKS